MGLLAIVSTTTASVAASAATMPTADLGSMITTAAQQFVASALPSAATTSTPVTEVAAQVPAAFRGHGDLRGRARRSARGREAPIRSRRRAHPGGHLGARRRNHPRRSAEYRGLRAREPSASDRRHRRRAGGVLLLLACRSSAVEPVPRRRDLAGDLRGHRFGQGAARGTGHHPGAPSRHDHRDRRGPAAETCSPTTFPRCCAPGGSTRLWRWSGARPTSTLVSWLNVVKPLALLVTVVLVVVLRLLTYWLGWQTPTATDLTPLVASAPQKAVETGGRALGWARRTTRLERRGGDVGPPAGTDSGDEQEPEP